MFKAREIRFQKQRAAWRRLFETFAFAAVVLFLSHHLQADTPEKSMSNIQIQDQGNNLIISWHFLYFLLPPQFILHERNDEPISLPNDNPQLLEKNLSDLALGALDLKINGETVQPTLVKLTTYPNKSCLVLLSYPGSPHSNVELRAPVLRYFPRSYFLAVSVTSSTGTKGAYFGKNYSQVVDFVQGDVVRPPRAPFFSKDFLSQWGAAWVNYNWILTGIVLLLMRQLRQMAFLIASIVVWWIGLSFLSLLFDCKIPYRIPELVLCIPTVLLYVVCVKYQNRFGLLTVITATAGFLNACFDIQQIPLTVPAQTLNALVGLSAGFVGGIALVLLVVLPLWWECKKYPGFQESWAPRISGLVVALAIFLPLQKLIFG